MAISQSISPVCGSDAQRAAIGNGLLEVMLGLIPKVAIREVDAQGPGSCALTGAVPMTGDVAAVLRVGMSEQLIKLCFTHMTGQDAPSPEDTQDTLAEIANILAGSIVRKLEDHALNIELGLPMIAAEEMAVSSRRPMTYLAFGYEVRGLFFEDHVRATFMYAQSPRLSNSPLGLV